MTIDFSSIHNHHEHTIFQAVTERAVQFPALAGREELLIDVACIALNRVQPRYIRHKVDYLFYLTEQERQRNDLMIAEAVDHAFRFVQSRERTTQA